MWPIARTLNHVLLWVYKWFYVEFNHTVWKRCWKLKRIQLIKDNEQRSVKYLEGIVSFCVEFRDILESKTTRLSYCEDE